MDGTQKQHNTANTIKVVLVITEENMLTTNLGSDSTDSTFCFMDLFLQIPKAGFVQKSDCGFP